MLKKRFFTSLVLVLSIVWTMALGVVPHHHHDGKPCFTMEYCEHDDAINDEHTAHHETEHGKHQKEDCPLYLLRYYTLSSRPSLVIPQTELHPFGLQSAVEPQGIAVGEPVWCRSLERDTSPQIFCSFTLYGSTGLRAPPTV